MSIIDQLIALLRNGSDTNALNQTGAFLASLDQKELGSVYQFMQNCIDSVYQTGKAPCDWIQLVSSLLLCSQTRYTTFLSLIKTIHLDVLPARDRFACTGELHVACLRYDMANAKDKKELKSLVKAILRPPATVFSKSSSMQPSDAPLALIDLLSTMVNGRRAFKLSHSGMDMMEHQDVAILVDFGNSTAPNFQSSFLDILVDQEVPIPLIPAFLSVLMESPLSPSQLVKLASQIRLALENHISSSSAVQATSIAMIPTWIQTSIIKSCFFFSHYRTQSLPLGKTAISNSNSVLDPSASWLSLLRFCMELAVLPWTLKSSCRPLPSNLEEWKSLKTSDPEFDPSVVLCVLDLQLRQSLDTLVVVLNHYARVTREKSVFDAQKRAFSDLASFGASDFLFLVLLLYSSTYQQPTLRLLLEVLSRLVEDRSMEENVVLVREMMEIPGVGPHSNLFVKLALHCVESTNVARLSQLGTEKIYALHRMATEMLCTLFANHTNSRASILTLCFAPSTFFASEWRMYFRKQAFRNISLLRDEFASNTIENITRHHSNLLLPLTRLILDTIPYLTTSHPNNPALCCRLLISVLPLAKLDHDFQSQIIIFLRKLLVTRSSLECTIALSGISHLLAQRLVPKEVQAELFDVLAQSSRLPVSLHYCLHKSVLKIAEKALIDWRTSMEVGNDENSSFDLQEHLEMAFQLLSFTRRLTSRHWSSVEDQTSGMGMKFQFSSFFDSMRSKNPTFELEATKSNLSELIQLLTVSCNLYGAILEPHHSQSPDLLSRHWPLHVVGIELLNTLVSTMNCIGNVNFMVLEALGVPLNSISNLKRRLVNLDNQYALLKLNLHEMPEKPTSAEFYEPPTNMIPNLATGLTLLDSISPKHRTEVLSDTYCILAEVLFQESRSLAQGNPSFVVVQENSTLSLSTALTKALFLLELRATMNIYHEVTATTSRSKKADPEEVSILQKDLLHSLHALSVPTISTLLRRFTLPESLEEGAVQGEDEIIPFLPKPSFIAVYDILTILNDQLHAFRARQDALDYSELACAVEKQNSALDSVEVVSSLLRTCFSILQIINTPEDRQMLPEDVNLNAMVEIIILNQFDCIRLTSDGCRLQLYGILESLFYIMLARKWDAEVMIGDALREFSEIISQQSSLPDGQPVNPKKRSREHGEILKNPKIPLEPPNKRTTTTSNEKKSNSTISVPPVSAPLLSSGLLCLYFTKQTVRELQMAETLSIVSPLCQLLTSLAALSRAATTQEQKISLNNAMADSKKHMERACAVILQFLSSAPNLRAYALKHLLSFVLDAFPHPSWVMIMATVLIEQTSSSMGPPRHRTDPVELLLVDWTKNIPIHQMDGARDVALELALDIAFEISMRSHASFDEWFSNLPQIALILIALRKMAISTHVTNTPRLWLKYLAICSKIIMTARFQINRTVQRLLEMPDGPDQLIQAMNGTEDQAYFEEDSWTQEGWLTTLATFGIFLRFIAQRLRSSFKRSQDLKIPNVLLLLETFEEKCAELLVITEPKRSSKPSSSKSGSALPKNHEMQESSNFTTENGPQSSISHQEALTQFQSLLKNCLQISCSDLRVERAKYDRLARKKQTKFRNEGLPPPTKTAEDEANLSSDDSNSWDSDIESVEEVPDIEMAHRKSTQAYRHTLKSQNQFIDEALKDEEILFQDEDDYADLVDWIDTGDE